MQPRLSNANGVDSYQHKLRTRVLSRSNVNGVDNDK